MTQTKQVEQLKLNVTNIHSFLVKENKKKEKLSAKKEDNKKRKISFQKKQQKEKQLEAKKATKSKKDVGEQVIKTSSMGLLDKLFNFGGLLIGGILVNAADGIVKEGKKFYEDNKEFFDTIGGFLTGVKDAVVGLFNSFTGPYAKKGAFDDFAKFSDDGKLQSGALKKVEEAYEGLDRLILKVDKMLGGKQVLATKDGVEGIKSKRTGIFAPQKFTPEQRKRYTESGGASGLLKGSRDVGSRDVGTNLKYGLVNPTPKTNILENKGGYATDTGLDIIGKVGDPIVSPVDGVLEYAERGHTRQMGQDSDPTKPGIQDQLSFRIRLNKPFTFEGKKVNFVYGTHLSTLDPAVANKFGIPIKAGQKLGTMGVANNVPHLHIGFIEDRAQTRFLDFKEVRRLLSGHSSNREKKGAAGLLKGSRDERNKQMTTINQPDPRKRRGSMIIAIQPVNTIQTVPYMMPFPVASKGSSSASTPQLSALWT